jgi:hypothetical protein
MKTVVFLAISLATSMSFAAPQVVPSFKDGSTVSCTASFNVGNDGKNYQSVPLEVYYRIDDPRQEDATAYFKAVPKLDHYSFDGSCSNSNCQLSIRETKSNIVSTTNGAYAAVNSQSIKNEVMDFSVSPYTTATIICQKTSSRAATR